MILLLIMLIALEIATVVAIFLASSYVRGTLKLCMLSLALASLFFMFGTIFYLIRIILNLKFGTVTNPEEIFTMASSVAIIFASLYVAKISKEYGVEVR